MKYRPYIKWISAVLCVIMLTASVYTGTVLAGTDKILTLTESWQLANNPTPEADTAVSANYKVIDKGYNPNKSTQATLSFEEPMDLAVSSKFSLKISSPIDEGYAVHNGDYSTTHPYISLNNQWVPAANAKAVLIQVKLPAEKNSGEGSLIRINFTDNIGRLVLTNGLKYHLLGNDYSSWSEHTIDTYSDNVAWLTLPNGFNGYIAFEVPVNYHTDSSFQIVGAELRIGTLGPSYGDFYFGGIYATTDFNKALKAKSTTVTAAKSLVTLDYMELTESWQLANNSTPEADENVKKNYRVLDKGYNPEMSTQATLTFEEPMDLAVSSQFSLKITSPVDEGYRVHEGDYITTHPYLYLTDQWVPAANAEAVLMQVKLPKERVAGEGSVIRVNLTDSNYSAVLNSDTQIYYLSKYSDRWIQRSIDGFNDGVAYLTLPNGFEGYIAFTLPSSYMNGSAQMVNVEIRLGTLGPSYGDFYFGGIYATTDFNKTIKAVSTTVGEQKDMSILFESGEWNALALAPEFAETKDSTASVPNTIKYLDKGYGAPTQGVMTYAEPLVNTVGAKTSLKLSSDITEGYRETTFPYIYYNSPIDLSYSNQLLLHIKLPELTEDETKAQFRLTMMSYTLNGEVKNTGEDWSGVTYRYLNKESNEWLEGTVSGYGTVALPLGFEGYVIFDLTPLTAGAEVEEFAVTAFEIRPAAFGKDHGDFYFGGAYQVYEFKSSLLGKINGADAVYMSSYRENDTEKMNAVRENINAIGDTVEFSDLIFAETARNIYESLVPNDKARIEAEYMEKLETAEKKLSVYKPDILGFKAKIGGEATPVLKAGSTLNINVPADFEVAEFGILTVKNKLLRNSELNLELAAATKTLVPINQSSGKLEGSALIELTGVEDYMQDYAVRSYVIYRNTADSTTVTVYNNNVVIGEETNETVSASLLDIASDAGIAIYAKQ